MIGSNKIEINNATMLEAIQFWLNITQLNLNAKVEVTSVVETDSNTFIVGVKPLESTEADAE